MTKVQMCNSAHLKFLPSHTGACLGDISINVLHCDVDFLLWFIEIKVFLRFGITFVTVCDMSEIN